MKPITTPRLNPISTALKQRGVSVIEVMVGISIGMILTVGLISTYVNSTRTQREMALNAEQIENGRLAIETISQDIRLAGYFEKAYDFPTPPTDILTDPCEIGPTTGNELTRLTASVGVHLQVISAADTTSKPDTSAWGTNTDCYGLLAASNLLPGSDILVVRRASTRTLIDPNLAVGTSGNIPTIDGQPYFQTGPFTGKVFAGTGANITNAAGGGAGTRADGGDASPDLLYLNAQKQLTPGPVAQYIQHIYFVSPCSVGTGTDGLCQTGDDSIPTLKRLELTALTGGSTGYRISSLVEGIQALTFDVGLDASPSAVSDITGQTGDGEPDNWTTPGDNATDIPAWQNTAAIKVQILARNTAQTPGTTNNKTYTMGGGKTFGPFNDNIKRHWYGQTVRVENISKRRERP